MEIVSAFARGALGSRREGLGEKTAKFGGKVLQEGGVGCVEGEGNNFHLREGVCLDYHFHVRFPDIPNLSLSPN